MNTLTFRDAYNNEFTLAEIILGAHISHIGNFVYQIKDYGGLFKLIGVITPETENGIGGTIRIAPVDEGTIKIDNQTCIPFEYRYESYIGSIPNLIGYFDEDINSKIVNVINRALVDAENEILPSQESLRNLIMTHLAGMERRATVRINTPYPINYDIIFIAESSTNDANNFSVNVRVEAFGDGSVAMTTDRTEFMLTIGPRIKVYNHMNLDAILDRIADTAERILKFMLKTFSELKVIDQETSK